MNKTNAWKWSILGAAIVAMFFIGRSCGVKSVIKKDSSDTTLHRDTTIYIDRPVPYKVDSIIYRDRRFTNTVTVYDTTPGLVVEKLVDPTDSIAVYNDFYKTRYYKNEWTQPGGRTILWDTVTQNRLVGREFRQYTTDTTIHKTTTVIPPKRIIGYLQLSAMGNARDAIDGAGIGFGLKMSNDMIYSIKTKWIREKRQLYEFEVSLPIRLNRK